MEKVTIGVLNYNGKETLPDTLQSIVNLSYPTFEVLVVDNGSTDTSRGLLQKSFPHIRCIALESNVGSAAGRNIILQESKTRYVLCLDNDIVLEPDALTSLMKVMQTVPQAAVCHPEIQDPTDQEASFHYNGGWVHYLCALVPRSYCAKERPTYEVFDVVSGGALLIDREAASHIGGFDDDYFFNMEDGDFTVRFTLSGYLCLNVPRAVVYHRKKPRGTSKAFYQVRNRWFFIIKLYSWRTILLVSPMLFLFEVSQALFLGLQGDVKSYWKGTWAAVCEFPNLIRKRQAFQRIKIKADRDWLREGELFVPHQLVKGKLFKIILKAYSVFFNLYWRVIRPLC